MIDSLLIYWLAFVSFYFYSSINYSLWLVVGKKRMSIIKNMQCRLMELLGYINGFSMKTTSKMMVYKTTMFVRSCIFVRNDQFILTLPLERDLCYKKHTTFLATWVVTIPSFPYLFNMYFLNVLYKFSVGSSRVFTLVYSYDSSLVWLTQVHVVKRSFPQDSFLHKQSINICIKLLSRVM